MKYSHDARGFTANSAPLVATKLSVAFRAAPLAGYDQVCDEHEGGEFDRHRGADEDAAGQVPTSATDSHGQIGDDHEGQQDVDLPEGEVDANRIQDEPNGSEKDECGTPVRTDGPSASSSSDAHDDQCGQCREIEGVPCALTDKSREVRQWPEDGGGKRRIGEEEGPALNGDLRGVQARAEDVRAAHPVDLKVHLGLVREPCEVEREGRSRRQPDHPEHPVSHRDEGEPSGGSRRQLSSHGVTLRRSRRVLRQQLGRRRPWRAAVGAG